MSKPRNFMTLQKQVKALSNGIAEKIQEVAKRKLASGGIDPDEFNLAGEEDWRLAKILVSAALQDPDVVNAYLPIDKDLIKIINNLKHF